MLVEVSSSGCATCFFFGGPFSASGSLLDRFDDRFLGWARLDGRLG